MIDKTVIEYIKQNLQNGFSIEQIKKTLVQSGHSEHDVDHEIYIATRQRPPSMAEILTKEQSQNNNNNNSVNTTTEENKNKEDQSKEKINDKDKSKEKTDDNSNKATDVNKKSHIGLIITLIVIVLLVGAPAVYFFAAQQGYVPYEPIQQVQNLFLHSRNYVYTLMNPTETYSIDNLPPPDRDKIPPPEDNPDLNENDNSEKIDEINTTLESDNIINETLELNDLNISNDINQSLNVSEEVNTTSDNQTNTTE